MQWWNVNHSENDKSGEQRGAQVEDAKTSEVDHEPKNPGETAPLPMPEPGSVHFDHAWRAEGLHVAVDPANRHEQAKHPPKRGHPEEDVHDDRAGGTNQHRFFTPHFVGDEPVNDEPAGVRQQGRGDNLAHVPAVEVELVADRLVRDREVVSAHVERGVQQADQTPVQTAARTKSRRISSALGRCSIHH